MRANSFNKSHIKTLTHPHNFPISEHRSIYKIFITCMFHVLGLDTVAVVDDFCPFACFVCCIIWLIKSSCWRVNPSLLVPAGELGDGDFELIAVIVFPSAFIWYWMQVAPCGELASPNYYERDVRIVRKIFISLHRGEFIKNVSSPLNLDLVTKITACCGWW